MGAVVLFCEERGPGPEARRFQPRVIEGRGGAAPGERLASLCGSSLRDEFFSWRGASGRRYVCSIFGRKDLAIVEQFQGATLIGVSRASGFRRAVCVLSSTQLRTRGSAGIDEWHVHFGDDARKLRDLSASLLR